MTHTFFGIFPVISIVLGTFVLVLLTASLSETRKDRDRDGADDGGFFEAAGGRGGGCGG